MIECINPLNDQKWESHPLVVGSPSFYRSYWARVLQTTYGFTPCYLIASDMAMPLMSTNSWLTGRKGSCLPFTDESEPLASHETGFNTIVQQALSLGRRNRWRKLELRGGTRWRPAVQPSVTFYGHALDLTLGPSRLLHALDGAHRRGIKKAECEGVTIEFRRDSEAMKEFYRLLGQTRQRHGVPPQPYRFFTNIQKHVLEPGHGCIVLARRNHVAVAGAVFFHEAGAVIYKYGASDKAYQSLRANNLVMWRALEWYANQGFRSFDFGRTSLGNEGLRRFKAGWGAVERTINYFNYDFKKGAFTSSRDDSLGWHNHLFKRLPPFLARWIGAALYKHIA